jgi:hypothetical protein
MFYKKKQSSKKAINMQTVKINAFRMNYLFKKVIRHLFRNQRDGSSFVKFLQPTGSLLSMKKLRSLASKMTVLRMYKKQKLYRRMLRTLLIFFRYLHPRPLVEQIAFELQQTKKH